MTATMLAFRSLRRRPLAATATFLAVLLGTVLIGSFATLAETAISAEGTDAGTLVIMGAVVGGWGAVIVLFSVASTAGITATQRAGEIGLLRTVGATPRQARRLIVREATAIALVGAVVGAAVASVTGRLLFEILSSAGMITSRTEYDAGPASVVAAAGLVLVSATLAAVVAARRATSGPAGLLVAESAAERGRMRWWRVAIAVGLVGYGVGMAVVTVTVTAHSDDPYAAMSTSGSSSILVGVGLAVLAPALLRWGAAPVRLLALTGSAYLAVYNASRRSHLLASVLAPVIVLTSAAVGTLMLVSIDSRTLPEGTEDSATITLLNNVVVGMMTLFAAIMVINAFVATVAHRRAELERLHRLGATPRQAGRSVVIEAGIVAAVGVVIGFLSALSSIIPFAVARHEGLVPDGTLWLPPVVVTGVVALTLAAARGAVSGTVRALGAPVVPGGGR